jgi:hypothetical protein
MTVYQLTYHCPDLHTQEDAEIVRESLMNAPGFSDIDVDWRTGKVVVATANQDGGKDATMRLINAGFRPEETL